MRILHPSQVDYIQQANSTNSTATTTTAATKCAASAKGNATIEQLSSTTADYSTDLSNLNGNTTERRYSYGLIDADDNVNLTISSSHNLSARYSRNQNHNTTSGRAESDSEVLCNNLNQLNNLKSNNKGQKLNGNDNDIRQIFEGNLNVLDTEEKTSPKRLPPSSNPQTLQTRQDTAKEGSESSSKSTSNISDEEDGPDEPEEEEDEEEDDLGNSGRGNLICNESHLNRGGRNSGGQSNPTHSQNSVELSNSGHINLSAAKLRQNLAKLDLDTNLQNCFQGHNQHQPQQFDSRQNQSHHTYKRVGGVTPHDRQSRAGRVSGYSGTYSCETSPDDSLMEDEDAYSPSPSSSNSLTSPEPSNFPRGIINPNYPGFQHLAHTLSEHFVNHSDADDSDLSEFEVELSVESLDESFERFHSNNCNNNNSLNNNNNDTITSISGLSGLSGEESMPSNDELNYNLEIAPPKENRDHKAICLPEIRVSSSLSNSQDGGDKDLDERSPDTDSDVSSKHLESDEDVKGSEDGERCIDRIRTFSSTEDISCDLDTYLKKFETSTDVKSQEKETPENDAHLDEARNCPTPDILIKNEKSTCSRKTSANRPDLLKNVVGVQETAGCEHHHENHPIEPEKPSSRVSVVPDNIAIETKRPEKDDGSYGVTPVDIIGDFGREIEREFGLIVSGYNTRILCRDYSPSACTEKKFSSKTADAVLSDGKEQLSAGSGVAAGSADVGIEMVQPECITCDLLQSTPGNFHRPGEKSSPSPAPPLERGKSKDEDASSAKVIAKNSSAANKSSSAGGCGEKLIPTAIVKPKYQKPSYDDRQLPPIGLGYSDNSRAWYESKCAGPQSANAIFQSSTGASGTDQRSRKMQQIASQLDRNVKFSKKILNRSSGGNLALSSKLPNSRRFDKDTDGSSSVVAVVTPRKKDKMETSLSEKKCKSFVEKNNNNNNNSRGYSNNNFSCMDTKRREGHKAGKDLSISASFDVYNIETALPVIDLEAIENHLKKAKEEERKRRNDREEIRRRLAMGAEDDYFSKIVSADRPGRKPSLQSRLQSGMNLQICFMNEASSDTESPSSDSETCPKLSKAMTHTSNSNMTRYSSSSAHPYNSRPLSVSINGNNNRKSLNRPSTLSLGPPVDDNTPESDFFTKQARLQIEARMALAQAKDMAHMQMEIERQKQKQSPITEVIRSSLEKVGVPFPPEKRRVSRQMLTDMNIAQLQIIVNELHTQIERLNEQLVQYLMERDELHMSQDSMLVDIEDLTRYLGAKEQSKANEKANDTTNTASTNSTTKGTHTLQQSAVTNSPANTAASNHTQSKFQRIASLVKK